MDNLDLEHQKHLWEQERVLTRAVIDYGLLALRSAFFANGGALVALLALSGSLINSDDQHVILIRMAIFVKSKFFVFGFSSAVAATFASYISQMLFVEVTGKKPGQIFRGLAIVFGCASLGLFIFGAKGILSVLSGVLGGS